jgi:hypothetical protein
MAHPTEAMALGLTAARRICEAPGDDWIDVFQELQRDRKLAKAMHQINRLLDEPEHRNIARLALQRIGFDHAG